MPELPEVEVVRRGLADWVAGRVVESVEVTDPRSLRTHPGGPRDFVGRLQGQQVRCISRRGKYLWMPLAGSTPAAHSPGSDVSPQADEAWCVHLGMSGQVLVCESGREDPRHLRVRVRFADTDRELLFVDQRIFGGMSVADLVEDGLGGRIPEHITHIARDPFDPHFDDTAFARRLRQKRTGLKRALLDQTLISGVGNIYADEALWRSKLHYELPTSRMDPRRARGILADLRDVMSEALAEGGTSFDALYVNVNGQSGYFERGLNAYGRAGKPCRRCGRIMVREEFMNRSSYRCPGCQRVPPRVSQ